MLINTTQRSKTNQPGGGRLFRYVASSIELYFGIIAEGTVCENAKLNIKRVKPMLKCNECESLFVRKPFSFECPYCGGQGSPTEIGHEFYIESIEI